MMRVPIAVGRGLDRATGTVASSPQAPIDARNVYARDAKMALRPGMTGTGFPNLTWGTDIIGVFPIKATLDEILVVYDRTSRDIRVYRIDTINGVLQTLASPVNGLWGTLDAEAEFPVVVAAESAGMLFLAHCEPVIDNRLPMVYYTPDPLIPSNVGTLSTYTAALSSSGLTLPVYPSFVFAYLEFLCYSGYGTDLDPDRGDIVHMSQPSVPLDSRPPNYFICGVKKDPIVALGTTNGPNPIGASGAPAAGQATVLVIAKTDETYVLNGTGFDNFAPQLLDPRYGVVSARAFQNIGGVLYGWSSDGARRFLALETQPIAQPLELISPLPADFPALGPSRLCFAAYDLTRYRLTWVFPDSENVAVPVPAFTLSLWNPGDPRWTFDEIQQAVCCAGLLLGRDTGTPLPPPVGFVSSPSAVDSSIAGDPRYRSITLNWTNNDQTGTEVVQVFARPLGGAWAIVRSIPVIADAEQQATWDTALPVTNYDLAFRYVNGTLPGAGYESNDPDSWTATTAPGAKVSFNSSSAPVAWVSGFYTGPSTPAQLNWASAQSGAPYLLEKSTDGGATYTTVAADLVATNFAYTVPPAEVGTTVKFRLTAQRGAVVGPTAGVLDVPMVIIVAQPTWIAALWDDVNLVANLGWNPANNATSYLIEKSTDGGATWSPVATIGGTAYTYTPPGADSFAPGEFGTTVNFRLTGKNGAISSVPSAAEPCLFDISSIVAASITSLTQLNPAPGAILRAVWVPASGTAVQIKQQVFPNVGQAAQTFPPTTTTADMSTGFQPAGYMETVSVLSFFGNVGQYFTVAQATHVLT